MHILIYFCFGLPYIWVATECGPLNRLEFLGFLNTILFKTKYKIFRKIQVAWWVSKTKIRFLAKYSHLYCFSFPLLKHSTNYVIIYNYNWPLNNMGLNCAGPIIRRFFSIKVTWSVPASSVPPSTSSSSETARLTPNSSSSSYLKQRKWG